MNWDYINETILDAREGRANISSLIRQIGDTEPCVPQELIDTMNASMEKLDECWTVMPEITERDLAFDTYWDKVERQDAAKAIGESIENEVRFEIAKRYFDGAVSEIVDFIMKNHGDLYEDWRYAMCEAADDRYDDHEW